MAASEQPAESVTDTRRIARQVGLLGSGAVIGLVLRLTQSALLARLLGLESFGTLATVVAVGAIVARVGDLGLPNAAAYFVRKEPGTLGAILRIIAGNFGFCAALSLLVVLAQPHVAAGLAPELGATPWARVAVVVYFAGGTPLAILPGLVNAIGDHRAFVRLATLDALIQACLAVLAVVVAGPNFLHVIVALAVAQWLAVGRYVWHLRRYRSRHTPVHAGAREVYRYGLRVHWGVVMKLISTRADLLIVRALLTASHAGLYAVALTVRDIGLLPQTVYAAPFQNLVVDREKVGGGSDRAVVLTSLLLQLGISLAMGAAATIALPLLIPLVYGPAFAPAAGPAAILFLSVIFLLPASLCWMTYNSKARPELTSIVLTASGVLGPLSTYVALRAGWGLYGAAIAGLATSALTFLLSVGLLWRIQRYGGEDLRLAVGRIRQLISASLGRMWPRIRR